MNIMSFKLLKDMPGIKTGDIISSYGVDYEGKKYYFKKEITISEEIIIANPDWFAPYLFTTEDGIDIYIGDEVWLSSDIKLRVNENSKQVFSVDKKFSSKKAAEDYFKPKFKVGDFVKTNSGNIHQIIDIVGNNLEFLRVQGKHSRLDIYSYLCILATNEEIIKYYEDLGWVKGARFTTNNKEVYTLEYLNSRFDGIYCATKYLSSFRNIKDCELVSFPKSWEEIPYREGYYYSFNRCGELEINEATPCDNRDSSKQVFRTEKQVESALAFAQLSQLVAEMNGDWQPDWNDLDRYKFVIVRSENRKGSYLTKQEYTTTFHPLAFKSAEARDFSFHHHENLWKQFWQI